MKDSSNYEITALRNTGAGGKSLVEGKRYKIPTDVSSEDAKALVRMGKAEIYVDPEVLAARKKAGEEAEKANKAKADELQTALDEANNRIAELETSVADEKKRADDAEAKVVELEKVSKPNKK